MSGQNQQMVHFASMCSYHHLRAKLTNEPIAWKTQCVALKCSPVFRESSSTRHRGPNHQPLSQGKTLILGCFSPCSLGVSWSNELFSREGYGAPVSRGIDCSGEAPDWHFPTKCNSPIVSSPLSVCGQNKEGKWLVERQSKYGRDTVRQETCSFSW